jgi:hypothetical protein
MPSPGAAAKLTKSAVVERSASIYELGDRFADDRTRTIALGYRKPRTAANGSLFHCHELRLLAGGRRLSVIAAHVSQDDPLNPRRAGRSIVRTEAPWHTRHSRRACFLPEFGLASLVRTK